MSNINKESIYTVGSEQLHDANADANGRKLDKTTSETKTTERSIDDLKKKKELMQSMRPQVLDVMSIFLAELIGTALLVCLGCMGCVDTLTGAPSHLQSCLSFGIVVLMIIQIFGCVSGAHINPAVTVAAVIYKLISVPMAILYVIAQLIGAFIGFGLLKLVTPSLSDGFCVTAPHADVSTAQAFFVEFVSTTVLIGVCTGIWDPRNAKHADSIPIKFGLTVAALALIAGPYTGCSMNPARSLGPAIWNNSYTDHWIYWIAPIAAAILTSVTYKLVFRRELPKEVSKECEEFPLKVAA